MKKYNLFMVGGAKGVGKTRLTTEVSSELSIERIETGKIVMDYVSRGLPLEELTNFLTEHICAQNQDLILDTHYARYPDREVPDKKFQRGLETRDLIKILEVYEIFPCLVEVSLLELEQRRRKDSKKRVINSFYINQEIEFNRKGYQLYLEETKKSQFILINDEYAEARRRFIQWITSNRLEPMEKKNG